MVGFFVNLKLWGIQSNQSELKPFFDGLKAHLTCSTRDFNRSVKKEQWILWSVRAFTEAGCSSQMPGVPLDNFITVGNSCLADREAHDAALVNKSLKGGAGVTR